MINESQAAGGGGYLRFFHDQLKYTVRDKFLDENFSLQTQEWMRDFFLSIIKPQVSTLNSTPLQSYLHMIEPANTPFSTQPHNKPLPAPPPNNQLTPPPSLQLCEYPTQKTPDYYEHVLNQVVHHQLKAAGEGPLDCLKDTLRNIYFVKERIVHHQQNALNEEYQVCSIMMLILC